MRRPNVLIVTTDQQRCDSLSCYGSSFTETPNLDRLASGGTLFTRAYCPNPVCTPSRVSLFSGLYPSRHGAWNVGMNAPEDLTFLSHALAAGGYATHYIGKAHFQAYGAPAGTSLETHQPGWEGLYRRWSGPYYGFRTADLCLGHTLYGLAGHYGLWVRERASAAEVEAYRRGHDLHQVAFGGNAVDWDLPTRLHNSVWAAERTAAWLREHAASRAEQPFLLAVGFQDPHHPHAVPRDFDLRVDPNAVSAPLWAEGELDGRPPHYLAAREGRLESSGDRGAFHVAGQGAGHDYRLVSEADARLARAYYHTMVRLIDRQMGVILGELERLGMAEDTLVVYCSDHGELLGDHGLWQKGPFPYECLLRVPLIVRWPRGARSGARCDAPASLVDIFPTVLAAAGLAPSRADGVDLAVVAGGTAGRKGVFVEMVDDPRGLRLRTVVTDRWKLTWYAGRDYGELTDLAQDPCERVNLWSSPAHAAVKAELLSDLLAATEPLERRAPRLSYA